MSLVDWADGVHVPEGIGIDAVTVSELRALDERLHGVFSERTFTARELAEAEKAADRWVYLAGRFAVKEAVFKALAHLTPEKAFDFRLVETLADVDGSPQVTKSETLMPIMEKAGITALFVSLSNEGDYAIAVCQATKAGDCPPKTKINP